MLIFLFFFFIFLFTSPVDATDWVLIFSKVSFQNPYETFGFVNPIFAVPPLTLINWLPLNISLAFNLSLTASLTIFLSRKYGASPLNIILVLLSPPFLSSLANGTLEWIPLLGFLLPAQYGLAFILAKPQSGGLIVLSWLRRNLYLSYTFAGIFLWTLLVWPRWMREMQDGIINLGANAMFTGDLSPFPFLIPIGIILFVLAYKSPHNDEILMTFATYCFVPYFLLHSTLILLIISNRHKPLFYSFWILSWIILIIN